MTLEFLSGGKYEENILSCTGVAAASYGCSPGAGTGTYHVDGAVVTFTDSAGPCKGMPGTYDVEVGVSLTFTHKGPDPCLGRQYWFDGRWSSAP
jgi:hypothetical protein